MLLLALSMMLTAQPTTRMDPSVSAEQKVRCRTEEVTGSLAGHKRVCHTAAEWRATDDAENKAAVDVIERGQRTCGECKSGN